MRSTVRTPTYSGTTTSSWSSPDLEDYGYESVEDIPEDIDVHPAEYTFLGEVDAEEYDEVSILPVVEPNGDLNQNALYSAKTYVSQVGGISSDTIENVTEKANMLLRKEFDRGEEEEQAKEFITSLYKDISVEDIEGEEFIGVNKSKLSKLVGKIYGLSKEDAKDMLDTLPEVKEHMEKEELKDTVKKVRNGEVEVEEALDKFVDVDKEVIDEVKEELGKEESNEEPKEENEKNGKNKDKEEITLEDKVDKVMKKENISKSEATVQVLDENPELYTKYKSRGG